MESTNISNTHQVGLGGFPDLLAGGLDDLVVLLGCDDLVVLLGCDDLLL